MQCNLDAVLTVREIAFWCSHLRQRRVTTHMVYGWIRSYPDLMVKQDGGFRYGSVLQAEARARTSDKGAGRGRPKAA